MQGEVTPETFYKDRRVLVTGGLGFIGSNLVRRLVDLEAVVTVIDAAYPDQGANLFNLKDVLDQVILVISDIGLADEISNYIVDQEVIFNLAACISHVGSLQNPLQDLERNCVSQLHFLNSLRELSPQTRIIQTGTRSQYGIPIYLPVDENHPLKPVDINGVHKTTVEEYHRLFHDLYGLRNTSLRLTNIFGPRHLMHHDGQGFLNWFIRQALSGQDICVYGDGKQERDFLYVEDVLDVLLMVAPDERCEGEVFNLVSEIPITVAQAADAISSIAGTKWHCTPYPPGRDSVEPGNIRMDGSRLQNLLGWKPKTDFHTGLEKTMDFYRQHGRRYFHNRRSRVVLTEKGPE